MIDELFKVPTSLVKQHDCREFDCGVPSLNEYLKRYALSSQRSDAARSYVACRGDRVVGYYTLCFGSVSLGEASLRVGKGLARHPIPVMVLARLAVDVHEQGKGVGKGLLKDAILRTLQAASIAGLRVILVHAKDSRVRIWYQQFGFESSPVDELHLMLLLKDARASLT